MKKSVILIAICTLIACTNSKTNRAEQQDIAFEQYVISFFQGDVWLRTTQQPKWVLLTTDMIHRHPMEIHLMPSDSVYILNDTSNVHLLETFSYREYIISKIQKEIILSIINDINLHDNDVSNLLMQELKKGIQDRRLGEVGDVAAASQRSVDNATDVAFEILHITKQILEGNPRENTSVSLLSYKTEMNQFFELKNNTNDSLYVNVLQIDRKSNRVNLCYLIDEELSKEHNIPEYLLLLGNQSVTLNSIYFPISAYHYAIIASSKPFIPSEVQDALNYIYYNDLQQNINYTKDIQIIYSLL